MSLQEKIINHFKNNQDQIKEHVVKLTRTMVKEKTVNVVSEKLSEHPYLEFRGEEYRVGKIVKKLMDETGIPYQEFSRQEGRPNIIGSLGKNETSKRLLMPAHMDIVPAGDGWDTDPYEVVEKEGFLYGRGTLDNKGPLASILVAGKIIKKLGLDQEMDGQLLLAALSDEEAEDPDGIDYGIGYLMEEKLIDPSWAIIPDIGENMKNIDIAEKGRTVFKITAQGKQAHGSTPEKGVNAIYMMAKLISKIEELEFDYQVHDVLGKPTLNLGEVHGGAAPNIVPGQCEIMLDIRTVPGMSKEAVTQKLEDCANGIPNSEFVIDNLSWNEPHSIDPDNLVVNSIQKFSQDILGFKPNTLGFGGGTYAKTLNLNGVISVGWGPGDDEAFHVANEYVEIQQLVDFAMMTCLVALDLLKE
ncbi:MAG TPA: ArgE/DapE family deacylase [bacterium]|nr:ArgE/DapE family deacylase [bacterium]